MYSLLISLVLLLFPFPAQSSSSGEGAVVMVNGSPIMQRELDEEIDRLIPRATFHGNITDERRLEFREKAIENLIQRALQYQDALARGLKPEKKTVKERLTAIRDRFASKREYKLALERAGFSEDDVKANVEKAVLVETVIRKVAVEPARVSEEELREYYEKNQGKFKLPESVKLRIITLSDQTKAAETLEKLKAGADFGDIAYKVSEDPYRVKGGDVGSIHRGRILQELEDAAFKLNPGELSGVVAAEGSWYIMRVDEKQPERQMSFDESKDKLKKDLESKRSAELMQKWMDGLRSKAKIEVLVK